MLAKIARSLLPPPFRMRDIYGFLDMTASVFAQRLKQSARSTRGILPDEIFTFTDAAFVLAGHGMSRALSSL